MSRPRRQIALLDEVCAGREPGPGNARPPGRPRVRGERPLDSIEAFHDCAGRYAALGVTTLAVLWPRGAHAARRLAVLEEAAGGYGSISPARIPVA
ncbi:hypothetical protein [Actinoplanes utahensis]|uniref:Luciferase-like domain-containing protein n=1 Tax=Actinoplanes utahensis TaxID=1869 RepID=A0A0A6UPN0_ACTUT|nr:hypothetical protein [Actinoplanes utahensis]KHD77391.1 hypothetical protein MB27_11650 [Actinoplanes utahensis]GIF32848.1 hypothetical protein Aut01nite_58340 [Actinoplanes utahensis]